MGEITTGVIIAVLSAVIIALLGIGNSKATVHITKGNMKASKVWKVLIVIGCLMVFGGGFYGISWLAFAGFDNPRTGLGISLFVLGLPILGIGKFGSWWTK
jgi:hypothetical protein